MSEEGQPLKVLLVVGNLAQQSTTRTVVESAAALLEQAGCQVDTFDCAREPLPLFDVETAYGRDEFAALRERVVAADVFVLGTPDYHGSMSSATKNFLDHFWKEYAGKLFVSVVGSFEKGLTVHDQVRTVARQCYAWSLPYGVSFHEKADFDETKAPNDTLRQRLEMMAADVVRYGSLLARQRVADLGSDEPGFLAHYRS